MKVGQRCISLQFSWYFWHQRICQFVNILTRGHIMRIRDIRKWFNGCFGHARGLIFNLVCYMPHSTRQIRPGDVKIWATFTLRLLWCQLYLEWNHIGVSWESRIFRFWARFFNIFHLNAHYKLDGKCK